MRKLAFLALVSLLFLFTGCKKESDTDTELIAKKLQEVIVNEAVVRVIPETEYIPGGGTITYPPGYGKTYRFNTPFIVIESTSYNLGSLKKYYISYFESDKTMYLVF